MRKPNFRIIVGLALIYSMSATQVNAQQVAIDDGVAYLRSAQSPDGSWGGTATSLKPVLQTTTSTARTLQLLGVTDNSLTNALGFLSAQTPDTVDDLARQLEVLAESGTDVSGLVASINSAQQADGGWGIDLGMLFPSEVVDTLSALQALKAVNSLDSSTTSTVLGYLLRNQNIDGGWGVTQGHPSEIFYTSHALLVLKGLQQSFNLNTSLSTGRQFLETRQNLDGSFGDSVFETAQSFQALIRYVLNPVSHDAVTSYLTSTQLADGSWDENAYSTSLALRALKDAQIISQSQIQAITLSRVLDEVRELTTTYNAFETMAVSVTTSDPGVGLEVIIQDSIGTEFSTRREGVEFLFDTQNFGPGIYAAIARAVDPITGIIIDEQTVTFTIEATVSVRDAVIEVTPRFANVGSTETIVMALTMVNRSNTAAVLSIEHSLESPTGGLLNNGIASLTLLPQDTSPNITLEIFDQTFIESGDHPIQADIFNQTELLFTASSAISIAPNIRIDPSKILTPNTVLPDGDKRIRIEIHLEGVEEQP